MKNIILAIFFISVQAQANLITAVSNGTISKAEIDSLGLSRSEISSHIEALAISEIEEQCNSDEPIRYSRQTLRTATLRLKPDFNLHMYRYGGYPEKAFEAVDPSWSFAAYCIQK